MNIQSHVETLRYRLLACSATRDEIAKATKTLSSSWVSKFASGRMRNPRMESLIALNAALEQFETREAA